MTERPLHPVAQSDHPFQAIGARLRHATAPWQTDPRAVRRFLPRTAAYLAALTAPLFVALAGSRLGMPAFVFEHAIILLVVAVAVTGGLGPALIAAVIAALGDNVLLRDPAGRPTISGYRDVLDAVLFVAVAVTVGWLVAAARWEKARAEAAAALERRAREERDSLVAMVTHDLATPLGVIRGSVQALRRRRGVEDVDVDRIWMRIDRAAARAVSLVRTLDDARSLDAGEFPIDRRPVELRSLIAGVVQMMDRSSERHPLALIMPHRAVMIAADAERLHRVFENLIGNAIKYSPDGGQIEIALVVNDSEAVVTIKDHGIGISPEARNRLFERGYRAEEAQAIAPGLGLGLNISWEIVQRHGGSLDARPSQPSGSLFILRLPIDPTDGGNDVAPMSDAGSRPS